MFRQIPLRRGRREGRRAAHRAKSSGDPAGEGIAARRSIRGYSVVRSRRMSSGERPSLGICSSRAFDHLKILFFAPHSAVWIHAFPEALLAESLRQAGHEIVYAACGGTLRESLRGHAAPSRCPFGAPPARQGADLHRLSQKPGRSSAGAFGFRRAPISRVWRPSAGLRRPPTKRFARCPSAICLELTLDGIKVGQDRALRNADPTQARHARFHARGVAALSGQSSSNVIVVLRSVGRLIDEVRPDRVVVYNALYSVNRAVCLLARSHAASRSITCTRATICPIVWGSLVLARDHAFSYYRHLCSPVASVQRQRPCPPAAMRAVHQSSAGGPPEGRSVWAYSAAAGGSAGPAADIRHPPTAGASFARP